MVSASGQRALHTWKMGSRFPELLKPAPKFESFDATWEWLALSFTGNRSQSSTEGHFVANEETHKMDI